jgi:putative FmdB family regulatory protein
VPTYQYACTDCGEQLEAQQRFTDEPLTRCPACGGRLRKVFNAVGVVFKGSGFYRTDSRAAKSDGAGEKKPDAAAAKASNSAAGDSAAGDSASKGSSNGADAKPAAKGGDGRPSGSKPAKSGASEQGSR